MSPSTDNPYLAPPPSKPLRDSWPDKPAVDGKYYGITDQHGMQICAMSHNTWASLGTMIAKLEATIKQLNGGMKRQNEALKLLQAANIALAAEKNDLAEKHKNLSRAYKKLKRAELAPLVEEPAQTPASNLFNPLG